MLRIKRKVAAVALGENIRGAWHGPQFLNQVFHEPKIGDVFRIALRNYRVVAMNDYRIEMEPA